MEVKKKQKVVKGWAVLPPLREKKSRDEIFLVDGVDSPLMIYVSQKSAKKATMLDERIVPVSITHNLPLK